MTGTTEALLYSPTTVQDLACLAQSPAEWQAFVQYCISLGRLTCPHVSMDGWMDGWMGGWVGGWVWTYFDDYHAEPTCRALGA